ncbi:MAG: restriction endonuclease subunit S [Candidatus Electrothrix sp. AR5]|nr:restriction endonuclease subunit S [Candidatus Electrothrix sp. AR5]
MGNKWEEVNLEDVARELTVGYVGSMASEYVESGIPFLRSKNVDTFKINTDDLKYISPEFHTKIRKSKLSPGDVVIVRTGKPGTSSVIPGWLKKANCSDLVIVRCGPKINNHFLSYYINTMATSHVNAHLVGAVQQHFNVGSAKTMKVLLPPVSEQEKIAEVLGALDEKIELNRQMNATLEAMAQALFKSWFVDFDPVIDKALAAGNPIPEPLRKRAEARQALGDKRKPLPADVAQHFPDRFVFNEEMGWVPEGWEYVLLNSICRVINGRAYKNTEFKDAGTPIIRIQNLSRTGKTVYSDLELNHDKYVDKEDFIYAWSATFGPHIWRGEKSIFHYHIWKLDVNENIVSRYFLYLDLGRKTEAMKNTGTGSIFTHLTKKIMESQRVLIGTEPVNNELGLRLKNLFFKITSLEKETSTLTQLRDTLLPKLLSGQLRIPDAEKLIKETPA